MIFFNFNLVIKTGINKAPWGLLLFLIFINDLPLSNDLDTILFADDTTLLKGGSDINETGNFVNSQLQKLGLWLRANELLINTSKTKVMVFSNKMLVPDFNFYFNLNDFDGPVNLDLIQPLERISNSSSTNTIKMLGVLLDENLSFNQHCQKICKKINSALFHLNSVKNTLSSSALTKLYYALIHPHLIYCLPVFSFTSQKNINLIRNKQKRCIRIIQKAKFNAHTEPLFFKAQILPLDDLILQQKLIFMHSLVYNHTPVIYQDFFPNREVNWHFNLRNSNDFFVARAYSTLVHKMSLVNFPQTWNDLDQSIKDISSKIAFKKQLKLYLLDKYSNFRCSNLTCYSCINV